MSDINKHNAKPRLKKFLENHLEEHGTLYLSEESLTLDYPVQRAMQNAQLFMSRFEAREIFTRVLYGEN